MSTRAAELANACRHLSQGRPELAVAALGVTDEFDRVGMSIRLVASGLEQERTGDPQARRNFERAYEIGAPFAPLLRECGRYFKRSGDYRRAHDCYARLIDLVPATLHEFIAGLPDVELARYSGWLVRRMLFKARPEFYPLQPAKAALARQYGREEAALVYAHMAGVEVGDVSTLPVAWLRDHAREKGLAYEEHSAGGHVLLQAPPTFGLPRGAPRQCPARAFYFCQLSDVIVSSKSNFLIAGGKALLDCEPDEWAAIPLNLDVDPIVVAPHEGEVTVVIGKGALEAPPLAEALSLVGVHSYNFGHWLVEFLPRVWACMDRPGFDRVPILIDEQMPRELRSALEFFVGPQHPMRVLKPGQAVRVSKLWTGSMISYFPVGPKPGESETDEPMGMDCGVFADLVRRIQPTLDRVEAGGQFRRVYLARQDTQHRKLVNRPEVEALFASLGFQIYDPGELSFADQLKRVRGAEVIIGPDGSGMLLSFLARPGTRIGYLNNPYLEEHWWITGIHEHLGHQLGILTGAVVKEVTTYRKFSDYQIDSEALAAFAEDLLAR